MYLEEEPELDGQLAKRGACLNVHAHVHARVHAHVHVHFGIACLP